MKSVVVVGSGAGGAAAASALAGDFRVTVLEEGRGFAPFAWPLRRALALKRAGLMRDPRMAGWIFRPMRIRKAGEGMIVVRGRGLGGSTTIATANALRVDASLRRLGIDLDAEFDRLYREIPVTTRHRERWRPSTTALRDAFAAEGLAPAATPKMADPDRCVSCGRCILGCPRGAKWDARRFLRDAESAGARVLTGRRVEAVTVEGGRPAVIVRRGGRRERMAADAVVIAAGGLGTPRILARSGVAVEPRLFVDPVLTVAAPWPGADQDREVPMPFVTQHDGFILAPYLDPLSLVFNRGWRERPSDIAGLMIKLADEENGSAEGRRIRKPLGRRDRSRLDAAVDLCAAIFARAGVSHERLFLGTLNGGHPGGQLPLTAAEAESLRSPRLPENVWVADATVFPESLGNPPILTIMALARKVAGRVAERLA